MATKIISEKKQGRKIKPQFPYFCYGSLAGIFRIKKILPGIFPEGFMFLANAGLNPF